MTSNASVSSPNAAGPAIVVEDLVRRYVTGRGRRRREIEAVRGLSFTVEAGERLAFIGPNGAGKSTSIKMLTGILHPTSGEATVLGLVPWHHRRHLARRIGTLFGQRSQLWNELTPRRSLFVLGAIHGMDDASVDRRLGELGELLDATDLYEQPLRTQSLGQRMRCELTACMLHGPELLFLDEPTIGLDLLAKQTFRDLLVRLNRDVGTTIFLTSHDVADVEHVAARVIVVSHGTIVEDDRVEVMRRRLLATKRVEVGLDHPVPAHRRELGLGTGVVIGPAPDEATRLDIDVDTAVVPIRQAIDAVLAALPVADLTVTDPPLETVIGEIYQRPR